MLIHVYILVVILLWASAFVGIRHAVLVYDPIELALFRYLTASATLFIIALFHRIRLPEPRDVIRFFITGTIGISVYNIALNYGELSVSAGEACFIVNTVPLLTALMGKLFLKEKLKQRVIFGMFLSFSGVLLIAFSFNEGMVLKSGSLIIIAAAVAQALYFVLQKPLLKTYNPVEVTCYCLWSGTLVMVPFGYRFIEKLSMVKEEYTISVIYLGIFPAALAYLCWAAVLKNMDAGKAASYLYAVPVLVILTGWIWLNEIPQLSSLIGGLMAVSGVIYANRNKRIDNP